MKKLFSLFILNCVAVIAFAQVPQGFNYQAVARNASGIALVSQPVGLQISLRQGTAAGTIVYTETHAVTSSNIGLLNLVVGNGTPTTGTFSSIDWSAGPYFIEISMDVTGGTSYSLMGTQQLMSVPYALYAANGTPGATGATGPTGLTGATGIAGINGTNGATGITGAAGINGSAGIAGPTGAIGAAGVTGPIGLTGAVGANGATGANGIAGATGSTGAIGDRYATLTTATLIINTGSVTFTVQTGLAYSIGQTVIIAFDASNQMIGSITAYNPATGSMTVNVSSTTGAGTHTNWSVNLNGAPGPAGAVGITGATGIAGTNGTNGSIGATGAAGSAGTNGTNGVTGPTGISGTNGTNGTNGSTGATGVAGTNGAAGATGPTGVTGANGSTGTNGLNGATGATGSNGLNGVTGPTGISGTNGTNGATGSAGTNGTNGVTGPTGVAGTNGAAGATGPTGVAGSNGSAGTNGLNGVTGPTGTNGAAGTPGAAGTNGAPGAAGATGPTGATPTFAVQFSVVNSGATSYLFDNPADYASGSNVNPTITLYRGFTYKFNVVAIGHPFRISASTFGGAAYVTGITGNNVTNGTLTFKVPMDAPATLFYFCTLHPSMAGTINIQ